VKKGERKKKKTEFVAPLTVTSGGGKERGEKVKREKGEEKKPCSAIIYNFRLGGERGRKGGEGGRRKKTHPLEPLVQKG